MDRAYFTMATALLASTAISMTYGRRLAVIIPTIVVGLYVSLGAFKELSWFIPLFILGAIPYAVISLAGAEIGKRISEKTASQPRHRKFAIFAIFLMASATFSYPILRGHRSAEYRASVEASAIEFLKTEGSVVAATGPVTRASVSAIGNSSKSNFASFIFYVEGASGKADVFVEATGTSEAPTFRVTSIESRK